MYYSPKTIYLKGIFINITIVLLGSGFQIFIPDFSIKMWAFPINIFIALFVLCFAFLARFGFYKTRFYNFLSSIPNTLALLTILLLMLLVLGFVPQKEASESLSFLTKLLTNITHSLPFQLMLLYLLIVLAIVILKRKIELNLRYLSFIINHLALWIVMFASFFGASDKQSYKMFLNGFNDKSNIAFNQNRETISLPFEISVTSFQTENYTTELVLLNKQQENIEVLQSVEIEDNKKHYSFFDFSIEILNNSIKKNNSEFLVDINFKEDDKINGFLLHCDNYITLPQNKFLVLKKGAIKQYKVNLIIENLSSKEQKIAQISVNHPYNYKDFDIYIQGVDPQNKGSFIILSIVKDPWLKIALVGLWAMLFGSLLLFIVGADFYDNKWNKNILKQNNKR